MGSVNCMVKERICTLNASCALNSISTFLLKDEVLITVGCPIFPPFYIDSQISVHRKFKKKIDQLIFRNANEIYVNEKFPIL